MSTLRAAKQPSVSIDNAGEFVGAIVTANGLAITFPKFYSDDLPQLLASRAAFFKASALLFALLRKYGAEIGTSANEIGPDAQDVGAGLIGSIDAAAALAAASILAEEFLRNGLVGRRSVSEAAEGAPDWGRTMRKQLPLLMEEAPLYLAPVLKRSTRDWEDELVRLHGTVIDEIGGLLGIPLEIPPHVLMEKAEYSSLKLNARRALSELRARRFRDRDLFILYQIELYLQIRSEDQLAFSSRPVLVGVSNFEYVWEQILRSVFANEGGQKLARLPSGVWRTPGAWPAKSGITPRVDLARAKGRLGSELELEYFMLVDAKYIWDSIEGGRWASHADLYKQMVYADLLNLPPTRHMLNVLAFPKVQTIEGWHGTALRVNGLHYWESIPKRLVFEVLADFERLARVYLGTARVDVESEVDALLEVSASANAAIRNAENES